MVFSKKKTKHLSQNSLQSHTKIIWKMLNGLLHKRPTCPELLLHVSALDACYCGL